MISLTRRIRQPNSWYWSGFTLIELLVAITIMLIIFSMTAGVVALAINTDRIPSSARTVQAAIMGARDRALRAGRDDLDEQPKRGVRFVLNPNIPNTVNSLVYVGNQDDWTQGRVRVMRRDAVDNSTLMPPADGLADIPEQNYLVWDSAPPSINWWNLKQNGSLVDGLRIKIPSTEDNWNRISLSNLSASNEELILTRQYAGTTDAMPPTPLTAKSDAPYELELAPSILPNEQPLTLDGNVVIHLEVSRLNDGLPSAWWNGSAYQQEQMEVLFSPSGNVSGPLSANGPIYLYLCEVDDVLAQPPRGPSDLNRGEALVLKITPQTGQIQTFPVSPEPGDPFKFAKQ